jgi:hypothetical protein
MIKDMIINAHKKNSIEISSLGRMVFIRDANIKAKTTYWSLMAMLPTFCL